MTGFSQDRSRGIGFHHSMTLSHRTDPTSGPMLRVLLVDDEPLALDLLEAILAPMTDVTVVGRAGDGDEASAMVDALKPDVVLSDIRMPRQGGLRLAHTLRAQAAVDLVFITAFDQFALNAYDLDVIDYLLKPVEEERLRMALDKARVRKAGRPAPEPVPAPPTRGLQGFWIQQARGTVWVAAETIDWIEAARDYVLLQTPTAAHILRSTMDALEQQLDPDMFLRVSRSAFVRTGAVRRLQRQGSSGSVAVLSNGAAVKVGGKFVRQAEARLSGVATS
ncbi:LytR/AlgR family response regulator transcription factor [Brevundimonas sp. NPDC092305]|uniref:LytR/AlgR family response regulator transcription factor n=1 Tax=Brevundimonas sp. NPDC092305 TaxID=3363957 RepID=UPI00380F8ED0